MLIRKVQLLITAHLICSSFSQNERSYDTNDWIPITQNTGDDPDGTQRKPTGRVLNLDAPAQKFFPDEFVYKKSRPSFQTRPKHKDRHNAPKFENAYKFEVPPALPQNVPPTKLQFQFPPQEVQLPNYQQPPPLNVYRPPPPQLTQYVPNPQAIRAPQPNQPSTYQQYQQLPVQAGPPPQTVPSYNTTFYQTINPLNINQELVGSLQFQTAQEEKVQQLNENIPTEKSNNAKDNVQLVYVPLENLKGNQQFQPVPQGTQNIYRQIESPRYETPIDKPHRLAAIEQDFIQQALQATKLQEQIQHGEPIYYQVSTTTSKPIKKRKPHQPPLAVYLEGEKQRADVKDVLSALHDAKSIAVQDTIQPNSPELFIGPSTLDSPEYTKFPLPYLNSIEGNRISKNIDNLPFFVAPLNFKAPPGFSKIPLPAPHVGSVVISNKEDLHGKRSTPRPNLFQTESSKQLGKDDTPTVTPKTETLTQQPYFGETYYNQGAFVPSTQPQLLQFSVNGQNKQYNLPEAGYNQQIIGNEYNLPLKSEPEVTTQIKDVVTDNVKGIPESSFQYSYKEEAAKPTPKNSYKSTEDLNYNAPGTSLSYTGPQTYTQEDQIPYQQQYNDYNGAQKQSDDLYRVVQQVRYEPIATTFDATTKPEQQTVNIKPKETRQRQNTNNYLPETQQKSQLPDISPLELAINEFELHQINTQLEEKPRVKNQYNYKDENVNDESEYKFDPELHRFASTPSSILRDTYDTTTRPTTKPRNRIRTRPKTTTLPPPEEDVGYTVLEDFSIKQKPQNNVQYATEQKSQNNVQYAEQRPQNNIQYATEQKSQNTVQYVEQRPQSNIQYPTEQKSQNNVHYAEQKPQNNIQYATEQKSQNTVHYAEQKPQYTIQQDEVQTERIPAQQSYKNPSYSDSITEVEHIPTNVYSLNVNKDVAYTQTPTPEHAYTLNQNLMDRQILQNGVRQNNQNYEQPTYEQQGQFEVTPHEYTVQPNLESTRGHSSDYASKEQYGSNEYGSALDDPSVRTLLVPKLLVPTTSSDGAFTAPSYLPTTEQIRTTVTTSTTTERPIETTTQSRVRSRTRGGNRFNTYSTTKRSVSRRRPTRVTTERPTKYTQDDYGTKSTVTKSRFRTRGRTTPNSITERQATTENEIHEIPTSEPVKIRTHPDGSQSYAEYDHSVDPGQIVNVTPEEDDYSNIYPTSARPVIQYDNTASTPRPNINVQITHPDEEDIPKEKVRVRGRIRDRPRGSGTSTERVSTRRIIDKPRPETEESEEEFYGFFRKPDFGPAAQTPVEIPTVAPRHRVYAYQTPSQHGEDYQLNLDNTHVETSTVRFIGEIVPKYTTSKEVITEIETETPKPRIRTRTRAQQRKTQPIQEQATRRSNIIRSRGKTHFKLPETAKKNKEDAEADVEGGNYPAQYLQGRRGVTTPTPNFQITVAPDEEDQALNPSLYRPSVVASPQEWHDASEYNHQDQKKTDTNVLETDENASKLTDDQPDHPYALPVKAITEEVPVTTTGVTSDELFKETTRKIEEQFEAINNFDAERHTEAEDEANTEKSKKQKRRKGVWKLVKHRPVDPLETSESQNYFSVLNSYHDIRKVNSDAEKGLNEDRPNLDHEDFNQFENDDLEVQIENIKEITTNLPEEEEQPSITTTVEASSTSTEINLSANQKEQEDFLDSIYEMFGMSRQEDKSTHQPIVETETTPPATTTLNNPTFPEELTEPPSRSSATNTTETPAEIETTTFVTEDVFTTPQLEAKHEIRTSTFHIQPWHMREVGQVRTSTSTEVSHETEICYKGRCIRSHDRKKRL